MFCVECGREGKLYEHICSDCFLKKHDLVKVTPLMDLVSCSHCGSIQKGRHWEDSAGEKDALMNLVESNIEVAENVVIHDVQFTLDQIDARNYDVSFVLSLSYDDLETNRELDTRVRLRNSSCDRCSKLHGNYFSCIVQIRANKRDLEVEEMNAAEEMAEKKIKNMADHSREVFMTKKGKTHGGWDFYLSTHDAGRRLSQVFADRFGGRISESSKLVGRRDGRDMYRMTFIVRIPRYRAGDFLKIEKRVVRVRSVRSNGAETIDLKTWRSTPMKHKQLDDAKFLGGPDAERSAVVVLDLEEEVQIMDPETYETITLKKPEGFSQVGDSVPVVKFENWLYLLPL